MNRATTQIMRRDPERPAPGPSNECRHIPLIISGPPRCGTTLLSAYFDGHSQINWLLDEGYFFEHLWNLDSGMETHFVAAAREDIAPMVEGLRDRSMMPPTHHPPSDFPDLVYDWNEPAFRAVLESGSIATPTELWDLLVDAYLAGLHESPRRYVCLKAADYGRSIAGALSHVDAAKCVLIVRDPLASLNSLKRYRERRGAKLLTWPTMIEAIQSMNRIVRLLDQWSGERIRWIRYEDLVANSADAIDGLLRWLGLDSEPAVRTPTMRSAPWSHNSSFSDGKLAAPTKRELVLTTAEVELIRGATRPFQDRFGYART